MGSASLPQVHSLWSMKSTGVYRKSNYTILEGGELEIIVADAQQVKKVPGRKTDVKDEEWLAELLYHSLLLSSLIPPALSASCVTHSFQ